MICTKKGKLTIPWQYNSQFIERGFNGKKLAFVQQESVFWRKSLNRFLDLEKLKIYQLAGDYYLWHSFAKQKEQLYVVDAFLGGYRQRKGRLSENKAEYYKEFNSLKNKGTVLDWCKVYFYKAFETLAGRPIKQRFSKNRISYKQGRWVLR